MIFLLHPARDCHAQMFLVKRQCAEFPSGEFSSSATLLVGVFF
jgi:hypothetical protein